MILREGDTPRKGSCPLDTANVILKGVMEKVAPDTLAT